jgi:hypothetical protein
MERECHGFGVFPLINTIPPAKELAQEGYNLFEPRVKRASLHFKALCKVEDTLNKDPIISLPLSATTQSPPAPLFETRTPTLDAKSLDTAKNPSFGPQRAKASPASSSKPDKEKRKRSRVTPEQLVHLEQLFSTERSPTAARRKEISDRLGMYERQTQIWFQNRSVAIASDIFSISHSPGGQKRNS